MNTATRTSTPDLTAPPSAATDSPAPFDLLGPLPQGTTVLEASAGTGKTYAIAALVARFLAEGAARLDQLLMVTFSRAATNELRSRIRDRLVHLDDALERAVADGPATDADDVVTLLTTGAPAELAERHERVRTALTEFDAATIATTHEFCQRMLAGLGVLGADEPGARFVEDLSDLISEVSADIYLQMFADAERPPLSYERAERLARDAVGAPHARLVPAGTQGTADVRYTFACRVREEVERRKQAQRLVTYDDMLTRLRDALADPEHGEAAARRLSDRYHVVLVDEFQDTDPIQWEIVRRAFDRHATMVLIGDPKQAIYAFRGADVFSYLDAVRRAEHVYTLDTNYRSDQALLEAMDVVFHQAALGEGIQVRPVHAAHRERRLTLADAPAVPVRLRYLPDDPERPRPRRVGTLRPQLTADLAADIVKQLRAGLMLHPDDEPEPRPIRPSDIAVLVTRNRTGEQIRAELTRYNVPAVMAGATSVFGTEMAAQWATLLTGLDSLGLAATRRIAMTRFVGWDLARLATADDDALTTLSHWVRRWAQIVARDGVAALLEDITVRTGLAARLLQRTGGERDLTDLRHIGQSLHAAAVAGRLGLPGLIEWLAERRREAVAGDDDRSRRLETDARAVQILTVHRAKGLQFPIVYLPDAWDRYVPGDEEDAPIRLHLRLDDADAARDTNTAAEAQECVLDVGGSRAPGRRERWARHRVEEDGESLRLLYVAATRAECQLVAWWQPSHNTAASPLQRLLFGPRRPGMQPGPSFPDTGDPTTLSHLNTRLFSLEQQITRTPTPLHEADLKPADLSAREFHRELDLTWRRTSYTALTAAAHEHAPASGPAAVSEPEPAREDDETPVATAPAQDGIDERLLAPCPLGELPGGTDFGTLVHAIAEDVDPRSPDLEAALREAATERMARLPALPYGPDELVAGLVPVYATPLGPLADEHDLAFFGADDRLAELAFELPLAGGDPRLGTGPARPAGQAVLADIGRALQRHLPATDPLAGYGDLLTDPLLGEQVLRGYLTGSIDAVLRLHGPVPRYVIVDYKTNKLGPLGQSPRLADYTPKALTTAMQAAHYPLQALLYAVALHRYLRWRQPGYDPAQHLGGGLYLFVRGMAGPDTPRVDGVPCGVFSWHPPAALVTDVSDLLDHGPRQELP